MDTELIGFLAQAKALERVGAEARNPAGEEPTGLLPQAFAVGGGGDIGDGIGPGCLGEVRIQFLLAPRGTSPGTLFSAQGAVIVSMSAAMRCSCAACVCATRAISLRSSSTPAPVLALVGMTRTRDNPSSISSWWKERATLRASSLLSLSALLRTARVTELWEACGRMN